ncbi:MAG: LacI family transcriptional regulator [Bacteroidetes bacterium]|jgi:LacI family transcriptional regulator|nr:LacI family transcriptional regulator [Bacteroidota bacterium]
MKDRIRIKDIAKKAGVSKGTVDRVLHNRGNVSKIAREKVQKAMKELEYSPNIIASALAYNRTWRIAVFLPDYRNDPFWRQPRTGINLALKAVRDFGISIQYFDFRDADKNHFVELGDQILKDDFDVVVLAPAFAKEGHEFLDKCQAQNLKYIQINTYLERDDEAFLGYIGQDSYQSGMLAAKLLNFGMNSGETTMILHLEKAVNNSMHLVQKQQGFEDFFKEHPQKNIQIIKTGFEEVNDKVNLRLFLEKTCQEHPNVKSIFVTTSKLFHLVPILNDLKKEECKLVGFDLIEENLKYLNEEKISFLINQNPLKQGYLAIVHIFHHLVRKKELKKIQLLPLDVVIRENVQYYTEDEREQLYLIV